MPFWKDSTKVPCRMIWVVNHNGPKEYEKGWPWLPTQTSIVLHPFSGAHAHTHNVLNSVVRQGWRVLDRKSQTCYSHSVVTPQHDSIWTRKFIFLGVDQWKNYSFWISQNNIWNQLVENEMTKPWQMANRHGLLFCIRFNASAERMEFCLTQQRLSCVVHFTSFGSSFACLWKLEVWTLVALRLRLPTY